MWFLLFWSCWVCIQCGSCSSRPAGFLFIVVPVLLELLCQYRLAMQASQTAKVYLDAHIQGLRAPDMVKKEKEMEEKQQQLEEIVSQLGRLEDQLAANRRLTDG